MLAAFLALAAVLLVSELKGQRAEAATPCVVGYDIDITDLAAREAACLQKRNNSTSRTGNILSLQSETCKGKCEAVLKRTGKIWTLERLTSNPTPE
jgi:hypothetical protein